MLPELRKIRQSTTDINVFRGLNRTCNTGFSRVSTNSTSIYTEFSDMKNMGSDNYPQLSPRNRRTRLVREEKIISNIVVTNGNFSYIDGSGKLKCGNTEVDIKADTNIRHFLVLHNRNIVIFPDKIQYNIDSGTYESLEAIVTLPTKVGSNGSTGSSHDGVYAICAIDKIALNTTLTPRNKVATLRNYIDITDDYYQKIKPNGVDDYSWLFNVINIGDCVECAYGNNESILYMCTSIKSAETSGVYYSDKIKTFTEITSYYVKILVQGVNKKFKVGDYIKISGVDNTVLDDWTGDDTQYIKALNDNYFKIYAKPDNNSIVIKVDIQSSVPYIGNITLERSVPNMEWDKIIEASNRLWGCSNATNEIYACKQGDPTNWRAYGDGIASDSYYLDTGCEGDFTGVARQNSSVIFFKENWALKLFGTRPSNYTLNKYNISGVEKGSSNSIVWLNGMLFYKGCEGIMEYSLSGQPVLISENLGNKVYKNAVAGRYGSKYYVSMQNEKDEYELFCFDIEKGLWHKEDETQIVSAVTYNDILYYIDGLNGYLVSPEISENLIDSIVLSESDELQREGRFEWFCETGDLYDSEFEAKYISRLQIGIKPHKGTEIRVLACFENGGELVELAHIRYREKMTRYIPIPVRRSEFLKLRIEGSGYAEIYGIGITYARGSGVKNGYV